MSHPCHRRRIPRAGVDPVRDEVDALALLALAADHPASEQVIAILLGHDRTGRTMMVVHDTHDDDAVLQVAELLAQAAASNDPAFAYVVLASMRPGRTLERGDGDRWLEASDVLESAGVVLLEWFVVGEHISCPRDHLGVPPRWRAAGVPHDP